MKIITLDDFRHGVRVANLSYELSQYLKLSNKVIREIYMAALLHDIGKAYLDPKILYKPYKLTIEEKKHVEKHSYFSYQEILKLGYPANIALDVLYHHENFDGSGYPTGIKGNIIPIGSRIIRICDIFDALTSDRPYRKALDVSEAISIMNKEINNYDPDIFKNFINLVYRYNTEKEVLNGN